MSLLSSLWARLAAAAAVAAAAALFLARVFRAGRESERATNAKAALDHQSKTATEVSRSDAAVSDPASARAQRIRKRFERAD
jgi:hypothetical protein